VLANNVDFRQHIPDAVTLPQLFKNNGWYSAREGKMFHMNVPNGVGTPVYQDEASWHHSVSPPGEENKSTGEGATAANPAGGCQIVQWISTAAASGQADNAAADHAIDLLEKHRSDPFFLAVGFLRPHVPFVAPAKFYDLYPLSQMRLPDVPPGDLDDIPQAARTGRPGCWDHMNMNEHQRREALRGYYASTSFMDAQVGRVLGALDRLQLRDNTIVVFWGDHGWHLGEHTRWQKMSLMEESARVPLIIAAPGMRGNSRAARGLVEFVDVYPTLADLAGITPPSNLEGQSLRRLLNEPSRKWKKAAFTQLSVAQRVDGRSVRTERYRYINWQAETGAGEELYDHDADPREINNLATSPRHASVLEEMRRILKSGWQAARA
jgi:uncharacterized sulfatase